MENLNNKIIVVTGASDGLGMEIALACAKEKAYLAILARDEERLKKVSELCKQLGSPKVIYYVCDLKKSDSLKSTVGKIIKDFSHVNVLINNAGIWQTAKPLEDITDEEIDNVIQTNLNGLIKITRNVLPFLKEESNSAIINIVSRSGIMPKAGQHAYAASKWGVRGFTEGLREELKGSQVRVSAVYQGGMQTDIFKKVGDSRDTAGYILPKNVADIVIFLLTRPDNIWIYDIRVDR